MPRKKKFQIRLEVLVPTELADFLDEMVEKGIAESVSQAVRKCIAMARTYMPEVTVEVKEKEK